MGAGFTKLKNFFCKKIIKESMDLIMCPFWKTRKMEWTPSAAVGSPSIVFQGISLWNFPLNSVFANIAKF